MDTTPRRTGVIAVLLGTICMGCMTGYLWTFFSLRLEAAQVPSAWIGYAGMAQLASILLLTHVLPHFLYRINLFRLHCITSSFGIVAFLLLGLAGSNMWLHIPLRFLLGCGTIGTYIIYEYWLNASASDKHRGKIMAMYCTCVVIGMSVGPLLVPMLAQHNGLAIGAGMGMFAASLAFVATVRQYRPQVHEQPPTASPWGIIFLSPTVAIIAVMFGLTESTYWSFLTIYGIREGLSVTDAALMLSLISAGGMAMQLPMGALADKFSPRFAVLLATGVGAAGGVILPHLVTTPDMALWLHMFLWGGIMTTIYTCAIILIGHEHKAANLANATLAFQMMYGFGSLSGPGITGHSIEIIGTSAVPWLMGLACAVTFVFTAIRTIRRKHG